MSPSNAAPTIRLFEFRTQRWLQFEKPLAVLEARSLAEVLPLLRQVEEQTARRGRWAAGFIAYEAAPAFDPAFLTRPPDPALPLLWFAIYEEPVAIPRSALAARPAPPAAVAWRPTVEQAAHARAIRRIRDHIRAGDTYQVNYTLRLRAPFAGSAGELFASLIDAQEPVYGAFLETADWALCGASPELFLEWDNDALFTKPMKGTRPRGLWPAEDRRLAAELAASGKDRAEHVMIVDMARNDLGRIARTGSVAVDEPFAVEPYPTVWQMTSRVGCATGAGLAEILGALFPAASITGAPKARTMALISELETTPRGAYTGAIGFAGPGRRAQFNVAIRTARIDRAAQTAEYGTGGGIVWDSTPEGEWEECRVKARILTRRLPPFSLLETLLWTPEEGYFLLERHLARLRDSASYFGFPFDADAVRRRLQEGASPLPPRPHRIRFVLPKDGPPQWAAALLTDLPAPFRLVLAPGAIDPASPFLYHKTTHRAFYEHARESRGKADDVLLWNPRGEITEATFANVIYEMDGAWFTPPVPCGLLGGVYRAELLERGEVRERPLAIPELPGCTRLRLVNSVRKAWDAELLKEEP
ncbi:MAG: aminodeoxychorismate synthase component I [Kiritimatiellia bacterium]